jgi:hypothetical protein
MDITDHRSPRTSTPQHYLNTAVKRLHTAEAKREGEEIERRMTTLFRLFLLVVAVALVSSQLQHHVLNIDETTTILVLGLPLSGSLALHRFFECNGLESAHYCCGSDSKKTDFFCGVNVPTCGECLHDRWSESNTKKRNNKEKKCSRADKPSVWARFDVETADPYAYFLPQHYALSLLQADYPNAIWILNTVQGWEDHVLHWHSTTERLLNSFHSVLPPFDNQQKEVSQVLAPAQDMDEEVTRQALQTSIEDAYNRTRHNQRRQQLQEIYQIHTLHVMEQAQFYGKRLIRIHMNDPNAGKDLAQHFRGFRSDCWDFDLQAFQDDWKDLTLRL